MLSDRKGAVVVDKGDGLSDRVGDPPVVAQVFDELPLVVYATEGPEHRLVAANAMFRDYTGREQMIGALLEETFAESVGQHFLSLFDQVLASGQQQIIRNFRGQLTRQDTGEDIEFYLDVRLHPRRDVHERVVGVLVDFVDVTEQVQQRQAAQDRAVDAEQRLGQAREVITALQRELLPTGVPVLPGVEIAASYLLADADTAAGGDWFDAMPLPDGRVALVVGDVVGHGVAASAVMGKLQVLLSEQLAETGSVDLALEAADRLAGRVRGARAATVCVVVLDPDTGTLDYVTAGHPPPLVVPAVGEPRFLAAAGDGPLGTGAGGFHLGHDVIGPGDLVLLYTDGVLERPGRDLAGASVELAQVAADVAAGRALRSPEPTVAERVTTQSLELLTRATGHSDDITLLAAQRVALVAEFAIRAVAVPETVGEVRAALGAWIDDAHVPPGDAHGLQIAVGELVSNAVEHAYRDAPQPGTVEVSATLTQAGQVRVSVRDAGRWREPTTPTDTSDATDSAGRGRGLWMASRLVDELTVEHPGGATEAFVGHRLSRPARLLIADTLTFGPAPVAAPYPSLVVEHEEVGRLRIAGPVDSTTASDVAAALAHASAAGTRDLTVDLAGVTHLASAGVSVFYEADARSMGHGVELLLYAPAGSPAGQILTLVALPHTVDGSQV